jgi:hypothetical protein
MRQRVSPGRCLAASLPKELPGVAGVNPAAAACGGGARFLREAYAWRSVPAEAQQCPQRARDRHRRSGLEPARGDGASWLTAELGAPDRHQDRVY